MNEETITEDTEEEIAEVTDEQGFEALDPAHQLMMERQGTKLGGNEVADETTDEVVDEVADEQVVEESGHLFELDDGTKVTLEEAKAGHLRHKDYTQKTQAVAEDRKKIEQYSGLIDYLKSDTDTLNYVIDRMREPATQQAVAAAIDTLQVPDNYRGDAFVEQTVSTLNAVMERLNAVEGGVGTINQKTTQEADQAKFASAMQTRLNDGYEFLKGKVENPPSPQEYGNRIEEYLKEQGLDPQEAAPYIIGHDPHYITGLVERAYAADISAANTDKVNSAEKGRKQRVAKTTTLRVAGKSKTAAPQPLPKGADGKIDLKASLIHINDAIEEGTRRRG